jgi:hypothetical protein
MTETQDFSRIDPEILAEHCSDETKKYFRKLPYEAGYCFELLCRACRDEDEVALTYVYRNYLPVLEARARRHPIFPESSQDAVAIARTALSSFYFAVKGEKFLQKFYALAQALAYLYTCVHTAVLEDVQHNSALETSPEDIPAPTPPSAAELQELWEHICRLLPDTNDQRLAYLRFVLEMKPAEIAQLHPRIWATARSVSVTLQDIRRHLRADPYLRGLAGLGSEPDDRSDSGETRNRAIDEED